MGPSKKQSKESEKSLPLHEKARKILEEIYSIQEVLGKGTYGEVLSVQNRNTKQITAAKIVEKWDTSPGELNIWKELNHPNIIKLLEVKRYEALDIFHMPLYTRTLKNSLDIITGNKPRDYCTMLEYFRGVAKGLNYLHNLGVCHLDIKANNILLNEEGQAIICDFSSLQKTSKPTDSYVLPGTYWPPEAWPLDPAQPRVDGKAFDTWSLGALIIRCLLRMWLKKVSPEKHDWWEHQYRFLFRLLQIENITFRLNDVYKACYLHSNDFRGVQNLLRGIFRFRPEERPSMEDILKHPIFERGNPKPLKEDEIWTGYQGILDYKTSKELKDMARCFKLNARTQHKVQIETKKILVKAKEFIAKQNEMRTNKDKNSSEEVKVENEQKPAAITKKHENPPKKKRRMKSLRNFFRRIFHKQ